MIAMIETPIHIAAKAPNFFAHPILIKTGLFVVFSEIKFTQAS
jgi:hypothetical protein